MSITEQPPIHAKRPAPPKHLLDPRHYFDPDRARLEFERMWSKVWQLACLDSDIPNSGDFYEYVIGDWSIVVVRQPDHSLKAFHNVCAHRGRRIKEGCGTTAHLQCPYHQWTWDLAGKLKDVPERSTYAEFADADAGLQEVKVDQWQHWVFITLDPRAEPLMDFLGEIPELLAPYRLDRNYKWHSTSTSCRCNWKSMVDAFIEAYHGRSIHPETSGFVAYADYGVNLYGDHSTMTVQLGVPDAESTTFVPDYDEMLDAMEFSFAAFGEDTALVDFLRTTSLETGQQLRDVLAPLMRAGMTQSGIDSSLLDDDGLVELLHYSVFPNLAITQFAFGSWMFRIRPDATDPDYCTIDMWYFHRVPDGQELPPPAKHQVIPEGESCGAIMDQDLRNLPRQQAGMRSPATQGLRLSSLEARIVHMHDVMDRYLAEGD